MTTRCHSPTVGEIRNDPFHLTESIGLITTGEYEARVERGDLG
jgi:hypothetical protein